MWAVQMRQYLCDLCNNEDTGQLVHKWIDGTWLNFAGSGETM